MDINEIAGRYGLAPLEEFQNAGEEVEFYRSFLVLTDHIPNKILEGVATSEEYANELYYREFARKQIDGGEIAQVVPLDVLLSTLLGVE